jgi:hypothetical protein
VPGQYGQCDYTVGFVAVVKTEDDSAAFGLVRGGHAYDLLKTLGIQPVSLLGLSDMRCGLPQTVESDMELPQSSYLGFVLHYAPSVVG